MRLNESSGPKGSIGTGEGETGFAFKLARPFISNTCVFRRWFMGFAFKLESGPKREIGPEARLIRDCQADSAGVGDGFPKANA